MRSRCRDQRDSIIYVPRAVRVLEYPPNAADNIRDTNRVHIDGLTKGSLCSPVSLVEAAHQPNQTADDSPEFSAQCLSPLGLARQSCSEPADTAFLSAKKNNVYFLPRYSFPVVHRTPAGEMRKQMSRGISATRSSCVSRKYLSTD